MKKVSVWALLVALLLTGCTGQPQAAKAPEELTESYRAAITGARDDELNEAYSLLTDPADELSDMTFELLNLKKEDVTAFAFAASLRNVSAYAVCAAMPAQGREEAVREGLETFIENQKQNFERYLEDQYAIAAAAKLETLDDGTVLLVMCEDQDKVLEDIKKSLAG